MLATCRLNGWDLATYRDPDHPLAARSWPTPSPTSPASRSRPPPSTAAAPPSWPISLAGLARAFGRIAAGRRPAPPRPRSPPRCAAHPEYVGGTRRDVTALIRGTEGLIAKDGAESVHAVGLADGRGIALKIADGAQRARPVVLAAVLRRLGVESTAYDRLEDAPVLGHGEPVGAVVAVGIAGVSRRVRAVLQRVSRASVTVDGEVVGELTRPGLLALVGVTHDDGPEQVATMARKIADLRILHDERSVLDEGAPVLVVSQFTLYADTRKGRRPSWNAAAPGPVAEPVVEQVVAALRERGVEVQTGRFGAHMLVELVNDGPVTILLDV